MKIRAQYLICFLLPIVSLSCAKKAGVYFVSPKDNAVIEKQPFMLRMGVRGMKVRPAGDIEQGSGHHHLIINLPFIPKGEVIVSDDQHLHYGNGQTEAEITLPSGKHTLTLQFANGIHQSYGKELSASIRLEVAP